MEHGTTSIVSLMLVTGIAFFIPLLLQKFRLKIIPIVVAEIIAGIIIGKSGFDLIDTNDAWLSLLSMFGLIYLMFLSGTEIDFSSFKKDKKQKEKTANPFIIASVIFSVMLAVSYGFSLLMEKVGLIDDPFFMTIILSTISLGVVVPVLKDKKLINTPLGQTTLLIAVVSDVVTMILFAYYLAAKAGDTKIVIWIIVLLLVVVLSYLVISHVQKRLASKISEKLKKGTSQIGTRGVFALILFLVALSETLGVENILGAFLAGVIISLLAPNKDFIHQLDSFGYGFLIPIFFVMVGVQLDLGIIFENKNILLLIPVVLVLLIVSRVLPTLILKKWFGYKDALSSGILLTSTMSLAIVAASVASEMNVISSALSSAIVLVAIITCFISPIFFNKFAPVIKEKRKTVAIIGANRTTLPVSRDLLNNDYSVMVFGEKEQKLTKDGEKEHSFPITELESVTIENLNAHHVFEEFEEVIVATNDDDLNIKIALYAREMGIDKTIVRIEEPKKNKEYEKEGFYVYSEHFSGELILKAMIHSPSFIRFVSESNDLVKEIVLKSDEYDGIKLRQLPYLGDCLIMCIYRGKESIIPHGDTILLKGDALILSGSAESIEKVKEKMT